MRLRLSGPLAMDPNDRSALSGVQASWRLGSGAAQHVGCGLRLAGKLGPWAKRRMGRPRRLRREASALGGRKLPVGDGVAPER